MRFKIKYQIDKKVITKIDDLQSISDIENKYVNIISIQKIEKSINTKKSTLEDYESFFIEFAMLLKANISLIETLNILQKNSYPQAIEEFVKLFYSYLESGIDLSSELRKRHYPNEIYFFINNAQNNGDYYKNIKALGDLFTYKKLIKEKLIKLISYPLFLFFSLIMALFFMMFFVLPQFEYIFAQFNNELPFTTQLLVKSKSFLVNYYFLLIGIIIAVVIISFYLKNKYRLKFDKILYLRIPIVSKLYKDYLHYQLFLIASISLDSNNKVIDTFVFIENSFGNKYFNKIIKNLLKGLQNGDEFSTMFKKEKHFEDYIVRLLKVADNTNDYKECFKSLSTITIAKIDKRINFIAKISEPLLLLLIGIFMLLMILGILSPVWELSKIG